MTQVIDNGSFMTKAGCAYLLPYIVENTTITDMYALVAGGAPSPRSLNLAVY